MRELQPGRRKELKGHTQSQWHRQDLQPEAPDAQVRDDSSPYTPGHPQNQPFCFFPNCWSHPTTEGQELIPFSKFSLLEATSLPPRTSASAGLPSVAMSSPTNGTYSSHLGGLRVAPMLPVEWKASQLPSRQPLIFSMRPHTVCS